MNIFEEGKKAWPQLKVSQPELDAFLAAREPTDPAPAADLYLVCACVLGHPDALATLERSVLALVPGWVSRIDATADFGDDVAHSVRALMLTGASPRLGTYSGKGSLEAWVRVAAVRQALKQKAGQAKPADAAGSAPKDAGEVPRADVEAAMEAVLAALDVEERAWLKLSYLDGVSLERAASLVGVPSATVARRIAALEGHVLASLRERLQHQLRLPRAEVESLLRVVRGQLEISLAQALKKTND